MTSKTWGPVVSGGRDFAATLRLMAICFSRVVPADWQVCQSQNKADCFVQLASAFHKNQQTHTGALKDEWPSAKTCPHYKIRQGICLEPRWLLLFVLSFLFMGVIAWTKQRYPCLCRFVCFHLSWLLYFLLEVVFLMLAFQAFISCFPTCG